METKLEALRCGGCGHTCHKLYIRLNGEIIVECIQCGSQSEITTNKPEIKIRNLKGGGTLCVF